MRSVLIVATCLVWMVRLKLLLGREDIRGKRFGLRLWIENSIAAAALIPVFAGRSAHSLPLTVVLWVGFAVLFGGVITLVMYMWGLRR